MRPSLFLIAAALTLGSSASALAQGGGGGGMGGGGTGAGGGGGAGTSGGNSFTGGGTTGGATSFTGGGTSFTGGGTTGTTGTTAGGAGGMRGGGAGGAGGTTFTPSPTNFLTKTWANPLYPGRPGSTNISAKTIGGFGQPSFGATGTTGRGTATANRGAGTGSRTNTRTNTGTNSNGTTPAITYALEVKFPTPPIATPQFQAELQSVVGRSSLLKTPGNVRVEVVGTTVILRGIVADDDEKRLVEGMVRLEPGVHAVQNELAIIPPKP